MASAAATLLGASGNSSGVSTEDATNPTTFTSVKDPNLYQKLALSLLIKPPLALTILAYRTLKVLTYVPIMSILEGFARGKEAAWNFAAEEFLQAVKAARSIGRTRLKIARVINDIKAPTVQYTVNNVRIKPSEYLKTDYGISFHHFSSEHFSNRCFKVITPEHISEMPSYSDPSLKAVMGSHFFNPGLVGIGFGCPNLAIITTKPNQEAQGTEQNSTSITQVYAKSLMREDTTVGDTKGKLQSGVFFVPTNLPAGALEAIEEAAAKFVGGREMTCVNTNCRILKAAGFTMDGLDLADSYMPTTFLEDMLFRNMYYNGQKVEFDIIKTTPLTLEEYFSEIESGIVTTPIRHWKRKHDTVEAKQARGAEASRILAEEERLLNENPKVDQGSDAFEGVVRVASASCLGNFAAKFWGRHTVYELELSGEKDEILELFKNTFLDPFPQKDPDLFTRLKRDWFFSDWSIRNLRRHLIGKQTPECMGSHDFIRLIKSSNGARLNYTLLPDRIILTRVHVATTKDIHRQAADWALSKHALISKRKKVCSAGEVWYDAKRGKIVFNKDSGTYRPDQSCAENTAFIANKKFNTDIFVVEPE